MKKIGRIILILLLALVGVGAIMMGVVLLIQHRDWLAVWFALGIILLGVAMIASAWTVARGASIKDMLEDLFLGLP